jgi:hypothetical protein
MRAGEHIVGVAAYGLSRIRTKICENMGFFT